jgi:hypothetical protein
MPKVQTGNVVRKSARRVVAAKTSGATTVEETTREPSVTADDVARRAYELYLQEGRPEGRQMEHWLRAEAELLSRN